MSDCKGHRVIDNPGATEQAQGIEARYPGVCVDCRGPIAIGERIQGALTGGWHHVTCPPRAKGAATRQDTSGGIQNGDATNRTGATHEMPGGAAQRSTEPLENPRGLPNGVWTIEGPRGHRTFRISTVLAPGSPQAPEYSPASQGELTFRQRFVGRRVLELLTGPDNTASYKGLAWYDGKIGKLWKFGQQPNVEILINVFAKLVDRGETLPGYVVRFARHCYKCNRLLTTPESIERGVGPVCAGGGWD